jgi:glutaredoxin-like protein NrdH
MSECIARLRKWEGWNSKRLLKRKKNEPLDITEGTMQQSLIVYSKNRCQGCDTLKARLKSAGIDFEERNIDNDEDAKNFLLSHGHRSVPVVYRNGIHVPASEVLA